MDGFVVRLERLKPEGCEGCLDVEGIGAAWGCVAEVESYGCPGILLEPERTGVSGGAEDIGVVEVRIGFDADAVADDVGDESFGDAGGVAGFDDAHAEGWRFGLTNGAEAKLRVDAGDAGVELCGGAIQ